MSIIWRRRRQSEPTPSSTQLATEAEAFLAGRVRDLFRERMEPVPPWAAVNALAHGDLDTLRRLAGDITSDELSPHPWIEPLAVLAREILALVEDDLGVLRELQCRCLVPLEDQLLADKDTPISPSQLVVIGRAELRHYR